MIDRFYCHVGDTGRSYLVTLEDAVGRPIDLTGCQVKFSMKNKQGGATKVTDATCVKVSATLGQISWTPVANDVDTEGTYLGWFKVIKPDNTWFTVPAAVRPNDFNQIIVIPTFTPIP